VDHYRGMNPAAAAAAKFAAPPPPLLNLGERILALVLDLLFCPGLTLPFEDPTHSGREWGAAGTGAPELAGPGRSCSKFPLQHLEIHVYPLLS
jgi:hypothetical protein